MSLADHYGNGYFPAGQFRVTINGTRFFTYNSGSGGVEFALTDGHRNGKLPFCLHEKALWKLANFAADLGISQEQMRRIDPERRRGFESFVGKQFVAVVQKVRGNDDKEYSEVVDWQPIPVDNVPQVPRTPDPRPTAPPAEPDDQPPVDSEPPMMGDDIPF